MMAVYGKAIPNITFEGDQIFYLTLVHKTYPSMFEHFKTIR